MFQLLHFSDTHNNNRAMEALVKVAQRYPNAHIAITGDVCTDCNIVVDSRLNELSNGRHVWLVPGEHDIPVEERLANLYLVNWATPFADTVNEVLVLGITTRGPGQIDDDLSSLLLRVGSRRYSAVVLLCHHRLADDKVKEVFSLIGQTTPNMVWLMCHGHHHNNPSLFANHCRISLGDKYMWVSHVYSANTTAGKRRLGAANLIAIAAGHSVRVTPVDLSGPTLAR